MKSICAVALGIFLLLCGCQTAKSRETAPKALFDLTGDDYDLNQLRRNPTWSGQDPEHCLLPTLVCNDRRVNPTCTQKHNGIDTAPLKLRDWLQTGNFLKATCFVNKKLPGHLNLDFATFEGLLGWDGLAFDGDYDFTLQPVQGGVTSSDVDEDHVPRMKVEFSSLETLNRADSLPSWWRDFRSAALENHDPRPVRGYLASDNRDEAPLAIITGLLGFDCVHGCHTELHPVYALAIRVRNEPDSERWVVMARNWGTQGWCSQKNHPLDVTELKILLPNPQAAGVELKDNFAFRTYQINRLRGVGLPNPGEPRVYKPYLSPGKGAVLRINLPDPRTRTMVLGEFEIQWTPDKVRDRPDLFACPIPPAPRVRSIQEAEEISERIEGKLSAESLKQLRTEIAETAGDPVVSKVLQPLSGGDEPDLEFNAITTTSEDTATTSGPESPRKARPRRDAEKADLDRRIVKEFCSALKGMENDPDYKRLCGGR